MPSVHSRRIRGLLLSALLITSVLILVSPFQVGATPTNAAAKIWVYTYQTNDATNKSIDLFFNNFALPFERTTNVSKLGDIIILVLGADMPTAPTGLKEKVHDASWSALLTCAIGTGTYDETGSWDVPDELITEYGAHYNTTYKCLSAYGRFYSDMLYYPWAELDYSFTATTYQWRAVNPNSCAETLIWHQTTGAVKKRTPAMIAMKNRTRFYFQCPIFSGYDRLREITTTGIWGGLDRMFVKHPSNSTKIPNDGGANPFSQAYEIPLMWYMLSFGFPMPQIAKDGKEFAYIHRADDEGYLLSNLKNTEKWVINSGIPVSMGNTAKYHTSEVRALFHTLVDAGAELWNHGYTHENIPQYDISNGTLHNFFGVGYNRTVYMVDVTGDTDYELWVDFDEDSVTDDDEYTNENCWLYVADAPVGGDWIFADTITSTQANIHYRWASASSSYEFWDTQEAAEQTFDNSLTWYTEFRDKDTYYGFGAPSLAMNNNTIPALISRNFIYAMDLWMTSYPLYKYFDFQNRSYDIIWMPSNNKPSVVNYPWYSTWGNSLLARLCGGLHINLFHPASMASDTYRWQVANFTHDNRDILHKWTMLDACRWFKDVMRKAKIEFHDENHINVDLSRISDPYTANNFTVRYNNTRMMVTALQDGIYWLDGYNYNVSSYSWSGANARLTLNLEGTGTQTFYVGCGEWGEPINVFGADSYSYDSTANQEKITVTFSSPESITLEFRARSHDVAVANVTPSKTVLGQGYCMNVTTNVENRGDYTETFNVTAYANTAIIQTITITLTSGNSTTVTFTWNTTNVPYGNYTIRATATTVPDETDTTDNTLIDGTIIVTIPGDVNGDRTVDIFDALVIRLAYWSKLGNPNWVPEADLNQDDAVNSGDAIILILHFGETC